MPNRLRESPRLKEFDYAGAYVYSLTLVTRGRAPLFRRTDVAPIAEKALARSAEKHGVEVVAYCFMPDHLHLLVTGGEGLRLEAFVHLFKQLAGFEAKKILGTPLWQTSYYDHVLRQDEDIEVVANYIWDNPVQAGLVSDRSDYAYSGPRELRDG